MSFGASIKNAFGSTVKILNFEEAFPVIFSAGSCYQIFLKKQDYLSNLYTFGLALQFEYQDVFNYDYRSGIKFGTELSFFEIAFLRAGYYSFKLDPSPLNGKEKLTDFTYGFGLHLPIDELTQKNLPLVIVFDVTTLKQPTYIRDFDEWDDFSVYSVNVGWQL